MNEVLRVPRRKVDAPDADPHQTQEWLVTNGLGGYASGSVAGPITRRYHGLLIAALPNPLGRMMMLNGVTERLRLAHRKVVYIGAHELTGAADEATLPPAEFRYVGGLPVWRFEIDGYILEKRVILPYRQNTVHVTYRLVMGTDPVRLAIRPAVNFRSHDAHVSTPLCGNYTLTASNDTYELCGDKNVPGLKLTCYPATAFTFDRKVIQHIMYRTEQNRGYEAQGAMYSPGYFRLDLAPGQSATLIASTDSWETMRALTPDEVLTAELQRRQALIAKAHPKAREGFAAEMVLAADQFLITPAGRPEDAARAHAAGDEVRTVIAGYHWFTDWGRDTMISLEGLTLSTGRYQEAGWILRTFAHYVRDGLIPNMFPEGEREGLYHTADATMWFFHALERYLKITNDRATLKLILPKLLDIVNAHLKGTRFGICVDPADGLLRQGQEGYQLTWMDAKVDNWVVTPRRGKAVEINALWYNALTLLERWLSEEQGVDAARPIAEHAQRARENFNRRFWYQEGGYLYDVIDGPDGDSPLCRPNQIFAISVDNPVLDQQRWEPVLSTVEKRLLTPVGLRSLAPGEPEYHAKYYGDLRSRDAAYHQGTVWAWLIGPFIDAWHKVHPDDKEAPRRFLEGFASHMDESCIGSVSEIFDAEEPYTPRGCIAQAWSVAEVLRAWTLE